MYTDHDAAKPRVPQQPAPLWIKLMLVTITILATVLLGRDLAGTNLNFGSLLSGSGLGAIASVLGDSISPSSVFGRLSATLDNYNRCTDKLGLDFGISTDGQALGQGDFDDMDEMMKKLYAAGMRYVQITVTRTTNTDATNVAQIVKMASGNHLMPIIFLKAVDGSGVGAQTSTIVAFYTSINEAAPGRKFVATTAPRKVIDDGGTWTDEAAIAVGVADQLRTNTDILLATPELRQFEKGSGDTGSSLSSDDGFIGTRNDEVKIFSKLGVDLSKFDILLVGIQNFDSDYAQSVSQFQRRGYFFYSDQGPASTFVKGKSYLQSVNNDKKIDIRTIVMDYGPSTDPDTLNTDEKLRERLGYDFGSFSDDASVQAVIFSKRVYDSLVQVTEPPPTPPPPDVKSCKVGENFASIAGVGAGAINNIADIGYGYGEVILNGANDVGAAIGDGNSMCAVGVTPVFRSCIVGNCGFTSGNDQANALKQVVAGLSACGSQGISPYVVCGHNEVESEFNNDFSAEGRWSHQCLNAMSGSGANIMTTIFNATHPDLENQVSAWKAGFGSTSDISKFACVGLNAYSIMQGSSVIQVASYWYDRLFGLDPFKNMSGCISETGLVDLDAKGRGKTPGLAAEAVRGLLEHGATFALGFNFTGHNPGWEGFHLTDDGRSLTKSLCNVGPTDKKTAKVVNTEKLEAFFGFVSRDANNCDYDLKPANYSVNDNSTALVCDAQSNDTGGLSAKSKIVCLNPNSCSATVSYTLQVGLPIRALGSNSVTGTSTHPYEPFASQLASSLHLGQYDFLNQYAANIVSSDAMTYAMPWLGSLMFNIGQAAKYQIPNIVSAYDKTVYDETSAYFTQTYGEEISEVNRGQWVWGYNSTPYIGPVKIPLERALCIGSICYDKYLGPKDIMSNYSYYDPNNQAVTTKSVAVCGGTVKRVDADPQNMVYGTEQSIKTDSWFGTGAQLCYEDWVPDERVSGGDNLVCNIIARTYCNEYDDAAKRTAAVNAALRNGTSIPDFYINKSNVSSGNCTASTGKINSTIQYVSGADSYATAHVKLRSELPPIPKFDIPGIYDSLANVYRMLQLEMNKRSLKIVFNELAYSGWESDVLLKAYTKTPKDDHKIDTPRVNNMLESFSPSLSPTTATSPSGATTTAATFDTNSYEVTYDKYLAEGNSYHQAHQYYEALGLLDEMMRYYTILVSQPVFASGTLETDASGKVYYKTGQADAFARLYGCDDPFNKDLEAKVGHKLNCIAPYALKESSAYVSDPLGQFLCTKGYTNDEECSAAQCTPDNPSTGPVVATGKYSGVTCPMASPKNSCFQGPYGGYTHCQETDLPLDLFNPEITSGGGGDGTIVAPESGEAIAVGPNAGGAYGWTVEIRGSTTGIIYSMTHLSPTGLVAKNAQVTVGQKIGTDCTTCAYGTANAHLHVSARIGGVYIDPYLVYGEILGCNAARPPADAEFGVYKPAAGSKMCIYGNKASNGKKAGTLNDNYRKFCGSAGTGGRSIPQADSNMVIKLYEKFKQSDTTTPGVNQPTPTSDDLHNLQSTPTSMNTSDANDGRIVVAGMLTPSTIADYLNSFPALAQTTTANPPQDNTGSLTSVPNCSNATCSVLNNKNTIGYPECPTTDYSICDSYSKMTSTFGGAPTGSGSCISQAAAVGAGIEKQTIDFLGARFTVNKKIVDTMKQVESDINSVALSHNGSAYVFKSGSYNFNSGGGFNARPVRDYEDTSGTDCRISNHSWGTALDINPDTNAFKACTYDIPPEVVWAFEKAGFRWGGRYGNGRADFMHFEMCSAPGSTPVDTPAPGNNTPIACVVGVVANPGGNTGGGGPVSGGGTVTREKILNLCSPKSVGYVDVDPKVVQSAYASISGKPDVSISRIQQILAEAKAQNLNPAYLFGFWLTEGGFLGDNRAGKTASRPNPVGYDFGCGISASCGIATNWPSSPPADVTNERFQKSLQCASASNPGCHLLCSYQAILSTTPQIIKGLGTQQPGIGGFLECYGPIADNNAHFAKNFLRMYDTLFAPGTTNGRVNNGSCTMNL